MYILSRLPKEQSTTPLSPHQPEPDNQYSGIVGLVIRFSGGRITDERHAQLVLLGVIGFMLIVAFVFWPRSGQKPGTSENDPTKVPSYLQEP